MGKTWGADTVGELDELLATGSVVVTGLRDLPWWRLREDRLVTATQQVETLLRRAFGVQVRLAAELEERGLAKSHAVSSTSRLLSQLLAITPSEARGRVLAAEALLAPGASAAEVASSPTDLDIGVSPELPELRAAVDAGEVGYDHSRVIITAMRGIPDKVSDHLRTLCERALVEAARDRDANRLKDVAEQIRNITDPDGSLNDLDATDRVELHIGSRRGDGLTPFRGLLDDLGIEFLREAVEPLAKPRPSGPDLPDLRPAGVRRGQALVEVCRRYLKAGEGPTSGGVRPHATVTVGLAELASGRGIATLDFVGTVSARIARLVTCDADVQPLVLGSTELPLDAWAKTRSFPPALRRAMVARDGAGCAWPDCDSPAGWCDAHHIVFWSEGGATVLENGVLLCGLHHTEIHRGRWICRIAADGRPEFIPPRWLDPAQRPRRNHLFGAIRLPGSAHHRQDVSGVADASPPNGGQSDPSGESRPDPIVAPERSTDRHPTADRRETADRAETADRRRPSGHGHSAGLRPVMGVQPTRFVADRWLDRPARPPSSRPGPGGRGGKNRLSPPGNRTRRTTRRRRPDLVWPGLRAGIHVRMRQ